MGYVIGAIAGIFVLSSVVCFIAGLLVMCTQCCCGRSDCMSCNTKQQDKK